MKLNSYIFLGDVKDLLGISLKNGAKYCRTYDSQYAVIIIKLNFV